MALTFASLTGTLASLNVTGVTAIASPPLRIRDAALPVGFPRLPGGEHAAGSFAGTGELDVLTCDYVVLVERLVKLTIPADFATTITVIDAVTTALKAEMASDHVIDGWTIRMTIEELEEAAYWAVVATIRASG